MLKEVSAMIPPGDSRSTPVGDSTIVVFISWSDNDKSNLLCPEKTLISNGRDYQNYKIFKYSYKIFNYIRNDN